MCGRFAQVITHDRLQKLERELNMIDKSEQIEINYNVAPTQTVSALVNQSGITYMGFFRWGLIPSWSREIPSFAMINLRSEGLLDKTHTRSGLQRRRCVIPANGFYEWRKGDKQPFYIHPAADDLLYMAGLYDQWSSPDGSYIPSLGIITTDANAVMRGLHHRMPALLTREESLAWLDSANQDAMQMQMLLRPAPEDQLSMYPVGKTVNSIKNNSPECLQEYAAVSAGADATIFDLMEEL